MNRLLNRILRPLGVQLHRLPPAAVPYISAKETVKRATAANMTISDFVEAEWGISGNRDLVISEIEQTSAFVRCTDVCEIGPGTGRYLEKVLEISQPSLYEIYETAPDWSEYLRRAFDVVPRVADGRTLQETPDGSRDLVHAHGLFVALPLVHAFSYFRDIVRVVKSGGWVLFDFYPESAFDVATIERYLDSGHGYPSVLPRDPLLNYFTRHGFHLVHEFWHPHGEGTALYFILQRS